MPTYAPDPRLEWAPRVLLRTEVGSTAHGTGLPGKEDYDEIGIMALPWQQTLGLPVLSDRHETIVYRPGRAEGERSQPGDYDLVVHSARKFCSLAAQGNPSILNALFGPLRFSTPLGDRLRSEQMTTAFWHANARAKFLGYARSQRERLMGVRGGKHTNRPELIEEFGFDTKYAMHMVRLGYQGIEYMETGRITLPIPGELGDLLRAIRRGEYTKAQVLAEAEAVEARLADVPTRAPDAPNIAAINDWLRTVHVAYEHP